MAINLSALSKPSNDRPIIATLFGEGGMGKTTLAAMFPDPVFIRTEDGTASLAGADNVSLFPVSQSPQDVFDAIEALATQNHAFKTVVFDSVTQFEKLCIRKILDDEPNPKCKNMAAAHGGYGKAFGILDGLHQELRESAGWLATEKGMNVIFLAHATTEELELPDIDKYSRYTVTLHKNRQYDCAHHYTNNVDLVAFIRLKTNVRGTSEGKKRAISDGEREIICFPVASNVSKNRFGISEPIPFNFETGNPFAAYLKGN
jgi:hypothetical protein